MEASLWYLFSAFILLVLLQVWLVYLISNYPASAHKLKRKWTGVVLSLPLFGAELRESKKD
jgi:type II secretory pathway component PulF